MSRMEYIPTNAMAWNSSNPLKSNN